MLIKKLARRIKRGWDYRKGFSTDRRIIVFESDDWGSIRMPSKEVQSKIFSFGVDIHKCPYNSFDSIESNSDLEELFSVLLKYKDKNGYPVAFTANTIMGNPNFNRIEENAFQNYEFEHFKETLLGYPERDKVFALYLTGIKEGVFIPQFHGREHLNIKRWLTALQQQSKETHFSFRNRMFGISTNITSEDRKSYLAAFDFDSYDELQNQKVIVADGLRIFEETFGYKSQSFISPNYFWHSELEEALHANGIRFIQGGGFQVCPSEKGSHIIKHDFGSRNPNGQIYLRRNCVFEPSINQGTDSVERALKDIGFAFDYKKPAIITSHRLNYIGSLNLKNRENNLKKLDVLLFAILKKWPDVEFMTSDQLGRLIEFDNGRKS